jgi:hypothetical protein
MLHLRSVSLPGPLSGTAQISVASVPTQSTASSNPALPAANSLSTASLPSPSLPFAAPYTLRISSTSEDDRRSQNPSRSSAATPLGHPSSRPISASSFDAYQGVNPTCTTSYSTPPPDSGTDVLDRRRGLRLQRSFIRSTSLQSDQAFGSHRSSSSSGYYTPPSHQAARRSPYLYDYAPHRDDADRSDASDSVGFTNRWSRPQYDGAFSSPTPHRDFPAFGNPQRFSEAQEGGRQTRSDLSTSDGEDSDPVSNATSLNRPFGASRGSSPQSSSSFGYRPSQHHDPTPFPPHETGPRTRQWSPTTSSEAEVTNNDSGTREDADPVALGGEQLGGGRLHPPVGGPALFGNPEVVEQNQHVIRHDHNSLVRLVVSFTSRLYLRRCLDAHLSHYKSREVSSESLLMGCEELATLAYRSGGPFSHPPRWSALGMQLALPLSYPGSTILLIGPYQSPLRVIRIV